MNLRKKLLVIAAKGPPRSVPVVGGILADLVGLADTETGDQIEDLKRLVRSLDVRLKGQARVSDALLAALDDADPQFRKPIEDLAYALAHPDAFLPDLATSLGALHACLKAAGDKEEALEAVTEGLQTLTPKLLALPQTNAQLMAALCQNYLALCKELGREPRADILGPILEMFKRLSEDDGEAGKADE